MVSVGWLRGEYPLFTRNRKVVMTLWKIVLQNLLDIVKHGGTGATCGLYQLSCPYRSTENCWMCACWKTAPHTPTCGTC